MAVACKQNHEDEHAHNADGSFIGNETSLRFG